MTLSFPYTYISCPCSDHENGNDDDEDEDDDDDNGGRSTPLPGNPSPQKKSPKEAEQKPFDPRHPRSNFSLFPPEHLLYCEECRDIKCPRCINEEQISYFCTSCLFETPSSAVRSEGNRCARNCFNCPICFQQMTVNSSDSTTKDGPWILQCNYCMWTTLDIGIMFEKPTNIRSQLDRIANGGKLKSPSKPPESSETSRMPSYLSRASTMADEPATPKVEDPSSPQILDPAARFTAMKAFYKHQLTTSSAADPSSTNLASDITYNSPASLTRILNLYASQGTLVKKKPKIAPMREALYPSEGLLIPDSTAPAEIHARMRTGGMSDTTSLAQRSFQTGPGGGNPNARFVQDLRPMPAPLATKRAKRCKECKHILVKPEPKPTSTRYRIKLVALGSIPSITLKPLPGSNPVLPSPSLPSFIGGDVVIDPGKPSQWILTLRNPLFDPVRVSLATPTITPGRFGHRITILCPQFEVGASSDVWDEALNKDAAGSKGTRHDGGGRGGAVVAEAGKVYDQGRNWTSVVLEVVPVPILKAYATAKAGGLLGGERRETNEEETPQDEDVVEIPVRVRLEWRHGELDDGPSARKAKLNEDAADDGRRELAYWMVLGVGRVRK